MQMFKDMQKFKGVQMSNCFLKYIYCGHLAGSWVPMLGVEPT